MQSTPILVLLAETGETPISYRQKWLASKFVLKIKSIINHPVMEKLINLYPYCKNKINYWQKRELPILIETLEGMISIENHLYTNSNFPCFIHELDAQIDRLSIFNINGQKKDTTPEIFMANIYSKFEDYIQIYTDGSMDPISNSAGIGIFVPQKNISFASRLPNNTQICTAEIVAINKALLMALEHDWKKVIILSDSKSALQKISKSSFSTQTDHCSIITKRGLIEANRNGFNINLGWIPGHSNIKGNHVADQLAKVGNGLQIPLELKLNKENFLPMFKKQIWNNWIKEWTTCIKKKNNFYHKVVETIFRVPWFSQFEFKNRRHVTTFIRMKSGHCLTQYHLFRIGIEDDPFCECGQIGTLTHVLFECPINKHPTFDLYQELIKTHLITPISICTLLNSLNAERMGIVMKFLDIFAIKL